MIGSSVFYSMNKFKHMSHEPVELNAYSHWANTTANDYENKTYDL